MFYVLCMKYLLIHQQKICEFRICKLDSEIGLWSDFKGKMGLASLKNFWEVSLPHDAILLTGSRSSPTSCVSDILHFLHRKAANCFVNENNSSVHLLYVPTSLVI